MDVASVSEYAERPLDLDSIDGAIGRPELQAHIYFIALAEPLVAVYRLKLYACYLS